jgi:hypothetical protein
VVYGGPKLDGFCSAGNGGKQNYRIGTVGFAFPEGSEPYRLRHLDKLYDTWGRIMSG